MPRLWPHLVRKIDHDRRCAAPHDNPAKRLRIRRIDLHVGQEGRHMDKIAGFRRRRTFSPRAPADFANARQDVGDRLLLAMMVNARAGSRLDLEQDAPQRRVDAELWRDCCLAYGAWRLCRSLVEPGRADNADGGIGGHVLKGSWLVIWGCLSP